MTEPLIDEEGEVRELTDDDMADMKPAYMSINPELYKMLEEAAIHHQKWMIDLFTPKGLLMLVPTLKGKK